MKEKLLIIGGPSGVGKTKLSLEIAKKFNGEIISCDSMQIYRGFNIGTAKIKDDEKCGINHYMIDIKDWNEDFSVSEYKQMCQSLITKISSNNKLPIMVGGTGLYIDAVLYDYDFRCVNKDEKLRLYYNNLATKYGNMFLCNTLDMLNINHENIGFNDTKRLIRLLETGNMKNEKNTTSKYDYMYICLYEDREKLYDKLNKRVDVMFNEGLFDEVKDLINRGVDFNCLPMQSIGYKEFKGYFDGSQNIGDVIELIKKNTRHYAKRQLTWFRNRQNIIMYDVSNGFDDLLLQIGEWIKK